MLQRGAVVSIVLGGGLTTATGHVAAETNAGLIESIVSDSDMSKSKVKTALDAFINVTTKALQKHDRASWAGFGSFSISKRSARTGRTPQTETPTENAVRFKCGDELAAVLDLIPGRGDERRLGREPRTRRRKEADGPTDESLIDAESLASGTVLSEEEAEMFLDAFIDATTEALQEGDGLSLIGFGSFSISKRSARTGRNPQTGKEIQIAARKVVKFKAGAELSKAVN